MMSGLTLGEHRGSTFAVPDAEELTACLICMILSVKKEANSLQALVDRNSEATDTGRFVSLSTVANKARELFLFLVMMSEKNDCRAFFIS